MARLSSDAQAYVRAYLNYLRVRLGSWRTVERALPIAHGDRIEITTGRRAITSAMAMRIARVFDTSMHHVLTGAALPADTCPHCGRKLPAPGAVPKPSAIAMPVVLISKRSPRLPTLAELAMLPMPSAATIARLVTPSSRSRPAPGKSKLPRRQWRGRAR